MKKRVTELLITRVGIDEEIGVSTDVETCVSKTIKPCVGIDEEICMSTDVETCASKTIKPCVSIIPPAVMSVHMHTCDTSKRRFSFLTHKAHNYRGAKLCRLFSPFPLTVLPALPPNVCFL